MMQKKLLPFATLLGLLSFNLNAHAAAFQSNEQSAANMGTANAGTAVADDASVQFYNPAAMAFVPNPELAISGIEVQASVDSSPNFATNFAGLPFKGNSNGPSTNNFVPAFYYIQPINDRIAAGLGVENTFGLSTIYNNSSSARYFATKSTIATFNINPSLAIKLLDNLSFGAGFDAQYIKARLSQAFDYGSFNIASGDVFINNRADDWGYGWNAGLFYQYSPVTKWGLAYHSQVKNTLSGEADIEGVPSDQLSQTVAGFFGLQDSDIVTNEITLPDYATLSVQHNFNPVWSVMGDATYINWSTIKKLVINFSRSDDNRNPLFSALPPATLELDYRDTWRFAVGQAFQLNDKLALKMGVAYDQSPVTDKNRDARLPDADRTWLAFGTHYQFTQRCGLDLSYAHVFFAGHVLVNQQRVTPIGISTYSSIYRGRANLYGLQFNYAFT